VSNNYYELYVENVLKLAETIVIKFENSAIAENEWITKNYGSSYVDQNDKASWRYYRHICGYNHPIDVKIEVTSLDTLQIIEFNRQNLLVHKATARAYQYGSRYYRELLLLHPSYERYILGVLYPADMATALQAEDGTILSYPAELIETSEMSLVKNMQTWIKKMIARWYNVQFTNGHSLFTAAFLGVLYQQLVPLILNLRLRACKTDEVHSFHIRQHLASHSGLDVYLDQMDRHQALFLYRNIAYIERNNGMTSIFELLTDKLLTRRSIPLGEYNFVHDTASLQSTNFSEPSFKKRALNSVMAADEGVDVSITLDEMLTKEEPLAKGNYTFARLNRSMIRSEFVNSLSNSLSTKVLESSMLDFSDSVVYNIQYIALNQWGVYSHAGLYNTYVRVPNPNDGSEITVNVRDAYIYFFYLFSKVAGVDMDLVPILGAMRVQQTSMITKQQMLDLVDRTVMDPSVADEILAKKVTPTAMLSVDSFTEVVQALYKVANEEVAYISRFEDLMARGYVQNMVRSTYFDTTLFYQETGTSMPAWLIKNNLPSEFTPEQCITLYQDLFVAATGVELNSVKQSTDLQSAMIGIMRDLSSYSVQFITDINSSTIIPMNWAMIRPGNDKVSEQDLTQAYDLDARFKHVATVEQGQEGITLSEIVISDDSSEYSSQETVPSGLSIVDTPVKEGTADFVNLGTTRFVEDILPTYPGITIANYIPEYQYYYDLSEQQQQSVVSVYHHTFKTLVNDKIDLADVLPRDVFESFKYLDFNVVATKSFKFKYMPSMLPFGVKPVLFEELGKLAYTGGAFSDEGFLYIGYEDTFDIFQNLGQDITVDGFVILPSNLNLPIGLLHSEYGIGLSIGKISLVTEHIQIDMAPLFHYDNVTIKFIKAADSVGKIAHVHDSYSFPTKEPFFSNPDSYVSPHYTLGGFKIGVDGKVIFE
jgi:hypothetical protein